MGKPKPQDVGSFDSCFMKASMNLKRLLAVQLIALLASCSPTRNTAATRDEDLTRFVLIIQEIPDGSVIHSWQRREEFDLSQYRYQSSNSSIAGSIMLTGASEDRCQAEYDLCVARCMGSRTPFPVDHYVYDPKQYGPWKTGKGRHCYPACMERMANCMKNIGRRPYRFEAVDDAVDWLKRNYKVVVVGSVIVIAGVVFVTVSAGAGAIILVPVVLVAASGEPPSSHITAATP